MPNFNQPSLKGLSPMDQAGMLKEWEKVSRVEPGATSTVQNLVSQASPSVISRSAPAVQNVAKTISGPAKPPILPWPGYTTTAEEQGVVGKPYAAEYLAWKTDRVRRGLETVPYDKFEATYLQEPSGFHRAVRTIVPLGIAAIAAAAMPHLTGGLFGSMGAASGLPAAASMSLPTGASMTGAALGGSAATGGGILSGLSKGLSSLLPGGGKMGWGSAILSGGTNIISALIGSGASERASQSMLEAYREAGKYSTEASQRAAQTIADAQRSSAEMQLQAAREAIAELRRQQEGVAEDVAPWVEAGRVGLQNLVDMVEAGPGEYEMSPGYQFQLGEGLRAIEASAAARGKQLSGGTMKALADYAQGLASQDYQQFLNQYYQSLLPHQDLSQMGLGAATNLAQIGGQTATNIAGITTGTSSNVAQGLLDAAAKTAGYETQAGQTQANLATMAGQARGSGYINQANVWTGALKSALENYTTLEYLSKQGLV